MSQKPDSPKSPTPEIVGKLKRWAIEQALPLWASKGYDSKRGGFQERLHLDGTPDRAAPRRLRVQARQIYVYAHAAALGWYPPAHKLMLDGLEFMLANYRENDGRPGYIFSIGPDGAPNDVRRTTYDHMFVLLALSWVARVTGDAQIRVLIDEVLAFIEDRLTAPDGSYLESDPPSLPRRQNPHMHAFESMLALHECLADPRAMPAARRLLHLMQEKFLDRANATITEFYTGGWRPAPGPSGDSVEPGHLAEWTALMRRHERLEGLPPAPLASELLATAVRAAAPATGFLVDEIDRKAAVRRAGSRLWPQTELARAWIAESEAGRPDAADNAHAILQALASHYLDRPAAGMWVEQFDASGNPAAEFVPATSLYHVFGAIAEADRVLGAARVIPPITPASKT